MCYSQYPSEGLDLLNKIKNIEVYMGNDNTKALSGMDMTTGSIPVKILKFSIPLMLAQILEVLFNMSDVAVVGKFSSYEALGAVGSTSLLVTLFTGFLIGMGCGVNVRVIYDDVGCWHVPNRFFEEMRNAGIEVRSFLKVRFPLFTSRVNYRNHRKIVVIDGRIGFVGGMNLAERYMRGFSWGIWRDTHILIEGKAVHGLQTAFLLDWYFVDRTLITASRYFPKIESCGSSLVQVVTSEPIGPWKEIMQGLTMAINGAKKYFYMQTPYFLPTEQVLAAMQTAALAGVDVRLMLPERADNRITHLGSHSYLADVMQAGVKVYFYKKGFLHSKLMVSDDMLSTVGSTNVDFRSFEHNFEVNAFMYDVETALEMKEIFLQDQRESTQIFLKNWVKRSWRRRAAESVVRLLAPLL